jgi:hypothetical protein
MLLVRRHPAPFLFGGWRSNGSVVIIDAFEEAFLAPNLAGIHAPSE